MVFFCFWKEFIQFVLNVKLSNFGPQQARFLTRRGDVDSVTAMASLDSWLSELPLGDGGLKVELLPGLADCVSQLLPQQPFHAILFPRTLARFGEGALTSSTNPCFAKVLSRRILATSGQTVSDVYKFVFSCFDAF